MAIKLSTLNHLTDWSWQYRPGIWMHNRGYWTIDLWMQSCTCAAMRNRTRAGYTPSERPCQHFLALQHAGGWSPTNPNPAALTAAQTLISRTSCRVHLPIKHNWYQLLSTTQGTAIVRHYATDKIMTVPYALIYAVQPLYVCDNPQILIAKWKNQ